MKKNFLTLLAIIIGIIYLFPILWMLHSSFLNDQIVVKEFSFNRIFNINFTFSNYIDVFKRLPFVGIIKNTILFILPIVTIGTLINSAAGFVFARLKFKGSGIVFYLITVLVIIPFETLAIPLFLMLGVSWGMMNTIPGLFLPFMAKAFNIYFMRQYYLSLPRELEEAALVEGASWYKIFFKIALPLSLPAIATCIIIDFVFHWSEYLWPLIMTNQLEIETVQLGLGRFYTLPPIEWGDIMAYSVLSTLPVFIIFLLFQKYLVPTHLVSGIKG
jgi:ABC-type glycerol-3-phosphate transport system permease component